MSVARPTSWVNTIQLSGGLNVKGWQALNRTAFSGRFPTTSSGRQSVYQPPHKRFASA